MFNDSWYENDWLEIKNFAESLWLKKKSIAPKKISYAELNIRSLIVKVKSNIKLILLNSSGPIVNMLEKDPK